LPSEKDKTVDTTQPPVKPKFGSKEARERTLPDGRVVDMASADWKAHKAAQGPKDDTVTVKGPKRGRPPKVDRTETKAASRKAQAEEYGVIIGALFYSLGATISQPHWTLSDSERDRMGDAVSGVVPTLPAHVAKSLSKASPWIKLSLVTAQVVGPRIIMTKAIHDGATFTQAPPTAPNAPEATHTNGVIHQAPDAIIFPVAEPPVL
jgi:hypothetical protein